jgi:hypothetical protein
LAAAKFDFQQSAFHRYSGLKKYPVWYPQTAQSRRLRTGMVKHFAERLVAGQLRCAMRQWWHVAQQVLPSTTTHTRARTADGTVFNIATHVPD